ncbi:myo-inositol 2-dehydrogenase [Palleronia marisminoris]|uniref:Inositol 2-dehydrogenase n=1 Tax=Palleronia marisminoris TaxID=315423 RepID=A0A1Y5S0U6_9RHOB|nr:inositol 2-dehydrogenase [Palleronia marisminoris]SFG38064.1 myo-inositol 2-dehydrogenase [Palleronia marisminoris]SLN29769.1 Inositol 2-dehydrogenase [Palleronia marisminoris]
MKVALFGAGRIGKVHAASIRMDPRSELVAVTDVMADAAEALAKEHGIATRSADEILGDNSIDAILIASSTNTHSDLIEAGVKAGKAIFCEKPIDLSLDRALKVREIAATHDRPIMMGFNRRFDPNFAALKSALDAGDVGDGELLSVTSYDPAPPPVSYIKVSGGLFRDMMIHDFDMCAFLFGMPKSVMAHGACLVDPEIGAAGDIDTGVVVLTYADGRIATIRNSRRAPYGYDQRVEVLGSKGTIEVRNQTENTVVTTTEAGAVSAKPVYFFLERYMRAYAIEWAAFVDACVDGKGVPATVQDGVNALALAEAANRSLSEGRPVDVTSDMTGA